jgi:hypothetical protein
MPRRQTRIASHKLLVCNIDGGIRNDRTMRWKLPGKKTRPYLTTTYRIKVNLLAKKLLSSYNLQHNKPIGTRRYYREGLCIDS